MPLPISPFRCFAYAALLAFSACGLDERGIQFERLDTGSTLDLRAVHFSSPDTGYAVGGERWSQGLGLVTHDGGLSWSAMPLGDKQLFCLDSDSLGWLYAAGVDAKYFNWQPGDSLWRERWLPNQPVVTGMDLLHPGLGLAVGGIAYKDGFILRITGDGAVEQVGSYAQELADVAFSDAQTAHAVGYGLVLRSSDGGVNWSPRGGVEGDFFLDLAFPTPQVGYAVGWSGGIIKTEDGGGTWAWLRDSDNVFLQNEPFRCLAFADADEGYIAGEGGLLWHTRNGGRTWEKLTGLPDVAIFGIALTADFVYLVGQGGAAFRVPR